MSELSTRVEQNSLLLRLEEATNNIVSPVEFASRWFDQTVWLRLSDAAPALRGPDLLNHLRRSLGGALGTGASPQASDGVECPWEPPCALDVFFREQLREDGTGLPKPFVTLAGSDGPDLIAGLRVFGFATEWLPAIETAFVDAVRNRLPWQKVSVARPQVLDRKVETREGLDVLPVPECVSLQWITPLDAENLNATEKVGSILSRLHRRLKGMARWHDAVLPDLTRQDADDWEAASDASNMEAPRPVPGRSGSQGKNYTADAMLGTLALRGDLTPFWPLLLMGERSAVGRGAVRGLGRYRLNLGNAVD